MSIRLVPATLKEILAQQTITNTTEHTRQDSAEAKVKTAAAQAQSGDRQAPELTRQEGEGQSIVLTALIGVGVAVLEPELIPGILIGAGAVLAPQVLPALTGTLRPLVKGAVKMGYSAATGIREVAAETREQVEDLVAEARAEQEAHKSSSGQNRRPERGSSPQQRPKQQEQRETRAPVVSMAH